MRAPVILCLLAGAIAPTPATAQLQTEPHPLDTFLTNVLNFTNPTGIRGTVRMLDLDGPVLWLNWTERSDDAPGFATGWRAVPGEALLAVHPQPRNALIDLRSIRNGAPVELVIQRDAEGKRRILSFRDLSEPRNMPLSFSGPRGRAARRTIHTVWSRAAGGGTMAAWGRTRIGNGPRCGSPFTHHASPEPLRARPIAVAGRV